MVQTYSHINNNYSVDMMFAYVNLFGHPVTTIDIDSIIKTLEYKGWSDPKTKTYYSPLDVISDPKNKKYIEDFNRIHNSNLNYPIIIDNTNVIDGVHRLTKAHLLGKKKIKAYVFSKPLMKKFLIDRKRNWTKINNMQTYDYIKLFHQRFCNK